MNEHLSGQNILPKPLQNIIINYCEYKPKYFDELQWTISKIKFTIDGDFSNIKDFDYTFNLMFKYHYWKNKNEWFLQVRDLPTNRYHLFRDTIDFKNFGIIIQSRAPSRSYRFY